MLQRIQTVFLSLVVILMLLTLIFPMWVYTQPGVDDKFMLTSFYLLAQNGAAEGTKIFFPYTLIAVAAIGAAIVGIIEIFKFKSRLTQMKLGFLNSILMTVTLGLGFWFSKQIIADHNLAAEGAYAIGIYLPVGAMICNVLANRFIRKDEKLVRSVDRIR